MKTTHATTIDDQVQQRFQQLPKVVQDAITSTDVERRLRKLADTQKLHVDQWESLENEVMLTLLGIETVESFEKNITSEVGVTSDVAHILAENINTIVFEPIRQELERQLEHPEAHAESVSGVEAARSQILGTKEIPLAAPTPTQPPQLLIAPATPSAPPPEVTVARAPASGAYKPGEASTERKSIVDDPYREPPQ
ncbi:hypothetical protein A3A38_03200 [Candidatus Kaiserbacteria bacterium RIFCSPLOWO2_01_FULL_53_17]|uniref:Uncharacterized protein n=1 Tax=Candidatus Kaiserbacteria bacterium RIFCSPLOWO2_01_FULL_53_17 TaxID=1798511 RepID=A0A1F6EG49_9BACT|nr:MAG: hypothetical protein A3A38_03200 [Candidatus Kaiserbacteria bacterium RIFCSPLOWO2_01_FULL_53_17]